MAPDRGQAQVPGLEYRHENLPKVFKLLIDGIPTDSPDYELILDWTETMRQTPFRGTPEQAQAIKNAVDGIVEKGLAYGTLKSTDAVIHSSGAIQVYNKLPASGRFYDIFAKFNGRLDASLLTADDIKIFSSIIRKNGFTLEKLKKILIKPAAQFSPSGMIYNGFPLAHLPKIVSSSIRSGLAYGPPGSVQIAGLFTTANREQSVNWGQVKARGLGFRDFSQAAAALFVAKLAPSALVLDLPDGNEKRLILQLGLDLHSPSQSALQKLSPYARHLIKNDQHGMSVLLALTGAKIYRTTIFMDAGLPMGKEMVIIDRSAITSSHFENADGRQITADAVDFNSASLQTLRQNFVGHLLDHVHSQRFKEAVALLRQAPEYQADDLSLVKNILSQVSPERRTEFLKYAITAEKFESISLLLIPEYTLIPEFINDPVIRKNLSHWFSVKLSVSGFHQLLYESYQEMGRFQFYAVQYLRALNKDYPAEAQALMAKFEGKIPDFNTRPRSLSGGMCPQLFRAAQ
ncbi:MAG: hypothetical protein IPJ84_14095 [Bdellovibrionales bacterium]|nr:hypothetical protein [Bdellovibrionales bacterium]